MPSKLFWKNSKKNLHESAQNAPNNQEKIMKIFFQTILRWNLSGLSTTQIYPKLYKIPVLFEETKIRKRFSFDCVPGCRTGGS